MDECVQMFKLLGMPTIKAKQEADAQCAYLSKTKLVDAIASEDMDLLTFGTEVLLRDINKDRIVKYTLSKILAELKLSYLQFIDLCILLGCDYCTTIEGVGPKSAYSLIQAHGNIEAIIRHLETSKKKYVITNEFKEKFVIAREYFLQPPVYVQNEFAEIRWMTPDYELLKQTLISKYSYDVKSIDSVLLKQLKGGHLKTIADKNIMHVMVDKTFIKYEENTGPVEIIDDFIDSEEKSVNRTVEMFGVTKK
jgi:flap endonuclease-1